MCGLAGYVDLRLPGEDALRQGVRGMVETMLHRGPDDSGAWCDPAAGVALGHCRLAIRDVSQSGHQPMISASGRYCLVYNGEVYNADELAAELLPLGVSLRGHSDTEVILEGCAQWGVEALVHRLNGIFAFALWDVAGRTLTLVRDRLGVKPLYWGRFGDLFFFASELKALRAHRGWEARVEPAAVNDFLRFNYVPAPRTIYQGVYKLEPGRILTLNATLAHGIETYWNLEEIAVAGGRQGGEFTPREALDQLDRLLSDAVSRNMVSDVPLGTFLSGGVDSALVTALMQKDRSTPIRTFTIGFPEEEKNEAPLARKVAEYLGTDHTEVILAPTAVLDLIPRMPLLYDEPFADSSQMAMYLVAEMASRHVRVALSGDGGDELFGGYSRYRMVEQIWGNVSRVPAGVRRMASGMALQPLPQGLLRLLLKGIPERFLPAQVQDKLIDFMHLLGESAPDALYRHMMSCWKDPARLSGLSEGRDGLWWNPSLPDKLPSFFGRMRYMDMVSYLPDDILTKVDRASMAVSLEVRVPILDHRVVAFSWGLPDALLVRQGELKWLLRELLKRYLPAPMAHNPKRGLGVPMEVWLRGPLREWGESLLFQSGQEPLLDLTPVRALWQRFQAGETRVEPLLWNVLMLRAWQERWM